MRGETATVSKGSGDAPHPEGDTESADPDGQRNPTAAGVWPWLERCVIGLPILSLGIALLAWLTYGIDLPIQDDWRDYEWGTAGSLDPGYLFQSANDTAYPVGKALDSLALRFIGGNAIAYQFLSMLVVLGSLLVLQFRLLGLTSTSRRLKIAAFGLTILMLQPGSYWGGPNLAYHQAIPLVAVLAMLSLLVARSVDSRVLIAGLALLSTISGFSYISGATSNLVVLAVAIFGTFYYSGTVAKRFRLASLALALPTLFSLILQLRVILVVQKGTHRSDAPVAYPDNADFWLYSLGKVGRSLFLPQDRAAVSLVLSVVVVAAVVLALMLSGRTARGRHDRTIAELRIPLVLTVLTGTILAYLALVAAGRANLRPEGLDYLQIFQYGFFRFHFFWLTLLWPWVFLVLSQRVLASGPPWSRNWPKVAVAGSLLVILLVTATGAMGHFSTFRMDASARLIDVSCAQEIIVGTVSTQCATAHVGPSYEALAYATSRGATFARTLPNQALLASTQSSSGRIVEEFDAMQLQVRATVVNGEAELATVDGVIRLWVTPTADTQLVIPLSDKASLDECSRISVAVTIFDAPVIETATDIAELFYDPVDSELGFTPEKSVPLARFTDPGVASQLRFTAESGSGFENRIRIDLTQGSAAFAVDAVAVLCHTVSSAGIVAPEAGSTLSCSSQNVEFLGGTSGVWHVRAGAVSQGLDYFAGDSKSGTSIVVTGLPANGSTVYVSLWHLPPEGEWGLVDEIVYAACGG